MEHTKHLWRAILILVVLGVAGIIGRHFLIPPSFGLEGPYRHDALGDLMAKSPVHGSLTGCQSCHQDIFDSNAKGKHATVRCEVCHAPLNRPLNAQMATHVKGQEKTADMPTDTSVKLCLDCHQKLKARPEDMPQIDVMDHLKTLGVEPENGQLQDGLCVTCHDAHNPAI